jgi:hypothetical protein
VKAEAAGEEAKPASAPRKKKAAAAWSGDCAPGIQHGAAWPVPPVISHDGVTFT